MLQAQADTHHFMAEQATTAVLLHTWYGNRVLHEALCSRRLSLQCLVTTYDTSRMQKALHAQDMLRLLALQTGTD
jgi:hypothetical protein